MVLKKKQKTVLTPSFAFLDVCNWRRGTLSKNNRCSGCFCLQVLGNILTNQGSEATAESLDAQEDELCPVKTSLQSEV